MIQFHTDSGSMKNCLLITSFLYLCLLTASATATWFSLDGTALGTLEDENLNVYIPRDETERRVELDEYGWPEATEEPIELEPAPTTTPKPRPYAVARPGYSGRQPVGCDLEACLQRCLTVHGADYMAASCTLQRCFCYRVAPPDEETSK